MIEKKIDLAELYDKHKHMEKVSYQDAKVTRLSNDVLKKLNILRAKHEQRSHNNVVTTLLAVV